MTDQHIDCPRGFESLSAVRGAKPMMVGTLIFLYQERSSVGRAFNMTLVRFQPS